MTEPSTSFRASKLEDWEIQAANRLRELFEQTDMTQKTFGATWGIGSPGMVSQYLNAKRPLGLQAAIKFAKGFKCSVADISPTLAASLPAAPLYTEGSKQAPAIAGKAQVATNNIALVDALVTLQEALRRAGPLDRATCKPVLAVMCDDPDRADLVQRALNILSPPSHKAMPETGGHRAAA